jgi:hypothetical protein
MKKVIILSIAIIAIISVAFKSATNDQKVTIYISHEVKDYDVWKKGFDADAVNRDKAGFKLTALYRATNNPNIIVGIMEAPSAEAAQNFLGNPDLKAAMEKAGVISAPDIKILNKVQ